MVITEVFGRIYFQSEKHSLAPHLPRVRRGSVYQARREPPPPFRHVANKHPSECGAADLFTLHSHTGNTGTAQRKILDVMQDMQHKIFRLLWTPMQMLTNASDF